LLAAGGDLGRFFDGDFGMVVGQPVDDGPGDLE
jgi:hypothetical protein